MVSGTPAIWGALATVAATGRKCEATREKGLDTCFHVFFRPGPSAAIRVIAESQNRRVQGLNEISPDSALRRIQNGELSSI
jgi:hypothetical protein